LTVELVERLAAGRDQRTDVVIFATPAGLEPTAALYHRRLAPAVSAALETGERALHAFAARQTCRRLRLPDALAPQLVNLNTPEDCRNVLPPR
jgi:molybdopterin-guanine dinucleotide biosynthesis protein A